MLFWSNCVSDTCTHSWITFCKGIREENFEWMEMILQHQRMKEREKISQSQWLVCLISAHVDHNGLHLFFSVWPANEKGKKNLALLADGNGRWERKKRPQSLVTKKAESIFFHYSSGNYFFRIFVQEPSAFAWACVDQREEERISGDPKKKEETIFPVIGQSSKEERKNKNRPFVDSWFALNPTSSV